MNVDAGETLLHISVLFQTSSRKSSVGGTKKKSSIKLELTAEQKKDIQDAFNLFDPKGTGYIEARDLKVRFLVLFEILFYYINKFKKSKCFLLNVIVRMLIL